MRVSFFLRLGLGISFILLSTPLSAQSAATAAQPEAEASQVAQPDSFPETVARVNEASISRGDLLSRVEAVRSRMRIPDGDLPLSIYRTVLNEMVGVELLYQASLAEDLVPAAEEVSREIDDLRSRFPDEEAFEAQLASENLTAERLREQIRKDLSVQKFVDERVAPGVEVTEQRKQAFYDENQNRMTRPEQLLLRHILVEVEEEASDEERAAAREEIEELRQKAVDQKADFAELARTHSDDPGSREAGGEMTVRRGQTVPPFDKAAFALEKGEISPVVETRFGFHIIQSLERTPEQVVPYAEVEERIEDHLRQEAVREELRLRVERMKGQASVEIFI